MFDRETWSRLRRDAYDRAGHRCQVCGRQGGRLWPRLASAEERRTGGPVDCHEVWEWHVTNLGIPVGVQRLTRLLVVCKDCHLGFHEGYALHRAAGVGIAEEAREQLDALRMLTNRMTRSELRAAIAEEARLWEGNKSVTRWVLDLSHAAAQEVMRDHRPVLARNNAARVTPDIVGGIAFSHAGTDYAAADPLDLAAGGQAIPEGRGQGG